MLWSLYVYLGEVWMIERLSQDNLNGGKI